MVSLGIAEIQAMITACSRCKLRAGCTQPVPGVGNPNARVVLLGEGPGEEEDLAGQPFIGRAGKLLRSTLTRLGLPLEDVFITNVVKCRPPNNRTPNPEEIQACNSWTDAYLDVLRPNLKLLVLCGGTAWNEWGPKLSPQAPLPTISKAAGKGMVTLRTNQPLYVFPILHPSFVLRTGEQEWFDEQIKALVALYREII